MCRYSVPGPAVYEEVIRRSRFIGVVEPVADEHAAERALLRVRTTWPSATHYVYALRLVSPAVERCSDDGEPAGTAGRPVLKAMQHKEVCQALLVVVRYFGGILLGAGGLARAYGAVAARTLDAAGRVPVGPVVELEVTVDYAAEPRARHLLRTWRVPVVSEVFEERVTWRVRARPEQVAALSRAVADLTGGKGRVRVVLSTFGPLPPDPGTTEGSD